MKKYEPGQMAASSRDQNYFPTLPAEIRQDVYSRMNELLTEEKEYCDKGNTWRIEMNPEGHTEGFAIHTKMCPNWDFCKAHGYEDFMPAICAQDHKIAEAMHGVLIRTHTVAAGDDYCDWWYFGDRQELPEEAARRLKEKK